MEVKGAIKLIDKIDDWLTNWQDDADSSSLSMDTLYIIDNIPEIKSLLQQGEKYRQILQLVEEGKIQAKMGSYSKIVFVLEDKNKQHKIMFSFKAPFRHLLCYTLEELEQKYFPKEKDDDKTNINW